MLCNKRDSKTFFLNVKKEVLLNTTFKAIKKNHENIFTVVTDCIKIY